MRVLVLGGDGMLGHKVFQVLSAQHETWATFRQPDGAWTAYPMYAGCPRVISGVDARDFDSVVRAFAVARPEAAVNGIGIIKQRDAARDPIPSITVNALFPHRLAELCAATGVRLVHVSTDCVFSGRRGPSSEADLPDPVDLYGRSKLLGEVDRPGALTLRTSIIGRDFVRRAGLLEWFLSHRGGGRVQGYTTHIYTGVTTETLARLIARLLESYPQLSGLYQVAAEPITKAELLTRVRDALGLDITVEPVAPPPLDRSLSGARLAAATGEPPPRWQEMIAALAADPTPYDVWRAQYERHVP